MFRRGFGKLSVPQGYPEREDEAAQAARTTFTTPNHPSYPAAHACYSTASAVVLAHLFPSDVASLAAPARESGDSRVWAGIHFPSDVAAGQQLGRQVALRAIERARAGEAPR